MHFSRNADLIAVRLESGEQVIQSLLDVFEKCDARTGFVQAGIGMLADPEFGYFASKGKYATKVFNGRFECLCLNGNIAARDGELLAHLHGMCANEEYQVFGGHLITATVGLTLEIMISVVKSPIKMYRVFEEESGLAGLLVE